MKQRKFLYGYTIKNGEYILVPEEAATAIHKKQRKNGRKGGRSNKLLIKREYIPLPQLFSA